KERGRIAEPERGVITPPGFPFASPAVENGLLPEPLAEPSLKVSKAFGSSRGRAVADEQARWRQGSFNAHNAINSTGVIARGEHRRYIAAEGVADHGQSPQFHSVDEGYQAGGQCLQCIDTIACDRAAPVT